MFGVPRQYLSVALMLSYKLNFMICCYADMDGFPRPSHICTPFLPSTVKLWNRLPEHLVSAQLVEYFRELILNSSHF